MIERAKALRASSGKAETGEERYRRLRDRFVIQWLEDEMSKREFAQSLVMLDNIAAQGVEPGLINYFKGEVYRLRNEEGDAAKALAAYEKATEAGAKALPKAYRALGLSLWKLEDKYRARSAFETYVRLDPDASDRLIIEDYIRQL